MGSRLAPWQSPPAPEDRDDANDRVWRRREFAAGLTAGLVVAVFTVVAQAAIDDRREAQADRREDVRFVRQIAADGTADKGSFRGMDLSDSNLSGLNLAGANFTGVNLARSDLTGTHLTGATLSGADLTGTKLYSTVLIGANMQETNLAGAELIDPVLGPNSFGGAEAVEEAKEQGIANAERALDLTDANLSGATIRGARFDGTVVDRANFSGAIFEYDMDKAWNISSFRGDVSMYGTKFYGTDLSEVLLPGGFKEDWLGQSMILKTCADQNTTWPESSTMVPPPPGGNYLHGGRYCEVGDEGDVSNLQFGPRRKVSDLPATFMKPLP